MPVALQTDKEMVKQLVIQGLKVSDIAKRYDVNPRTIQTWINREGWKRIATETITIMSEVKQPLLSDSVAKASIDARNAVAKHLQATFAKLPEPKTWREGAKQQKELESAIRNGNTVFSWSESTSQSMINSRSVSSFELPISNESGNKMATDTQVIPAQCQDTGLQPVTLPTEPTKGE